MSRLEKRILWRQVRNSQTASNSLKQDLVGRIGFQSNMIRATGPHASRTQYGNWLLDMMLETGMKDRNESRITSDMSAHGWIAGKGEGC